MMDEMLLNFLGGARKRCRGDYELRVLPAAELLAAQQEAVASGCPPEAMGLMRNACVLCRAVYQRDQRVFPDGKSLLEAWSAEKIREEIEIYRRMAAQVDISCGQEAELERLRACLRGEPMERIRWKVLRAFSVLPSEKRAREMTEGDYLQCALHLLLDREERLEKLCPDCRRRQEASRCPVCGRETAGELAENPKFDRERFEELKQHG